MRYKIASVIGTVLFSFTAFTALSLPVRAADSLNDQINKAASGTTILLDKDYDETLEIGQDKDIILDLNGYKLTSGGNRVIHNSGKLTIIDTKGGGSIERESGDVGSIDGILNEQSGTLKLEGVNITIAVTSGDGVSTAIHNKGKISKINGGDVKSTTKGSAYAYALWNDGGTVDDISDGWFYGAGLADHQNTTNSLAVNNASGTVNISGGIFVGLVRTAGNGFGIRSAGTANLSGGSFLGVNGIGYYYYDGNIHGPQTIDVIANGDGTVNYQNNTHLTDNLDGPRVVLGEGQHYVTFLDETETPIATYVLDGNRNIVKKMGHVQSSYNVYIDKKTEVVTEEDLSRYGGDTILYVNTGDQREVMMFLGSSVTYGTNNWGNSWADYLGDEYGDEVIIRKRALSGTTLVNTERESYIGRMLTEINKNAKIDHLVVQLSTNDSGWGLPLGTLGAPDEFRSEAFDNRIDTYGKKDSREIINGMEFIIAYAKETWGCKVTFWSGPNNGRESYDKMEDALVKQILPKWEKKGMGVIDYYSFWFPEKGVVINDDMVHPYQAGYKQMVPYAYDYLCDFDAKIASKYIDEIGTVTADNNCGERIARARDAYQYMVKGAKANVKNYDKLVEAEAQYAALFNEARKIDNASEVSVISGPQGVADENYDKLLDGKIATKSATDNHMTTPFIWKVNRPIALKYYALTTANDNDVWKGRNPKSWKLYGSNDVDANGNGTWTEIASVDNDSYLKDERHYQVFYTVDHPQKYSYYKWEFPNQQVPFFQMSEFTMYEDIKEEIDREAAAKVDTLIARVTNLLSYNQKEDIVKARNAYDELTDSQKTYVTLYEQLVNAETSIEKYKDATAYLLNMNDFAFNADITSGVSILYDEDSPVNYAFEGGFKVPDENDKINSVLSGDAHFTIALWVKPDDLQKDNTFVMKGDNQVSLKTTAKGLEYYIYDNKWNTVDVSFEDAGFKVKQWNYLVATYDGTTMKLYVNGKEVGKQEIQTSINPGGDPLGVGQSYAPNNESRRLRGSMASMHIYDIALEPAAIENQYQADLDNQEALLNDESDGVVFWYDADKYKVVYSNGEEEYSVGAQQELDAIEAQNVIAIIDEIGEVSLDKEELIQSARNSYDNLTENQKKLVSNYAMLEQAESVLQSIKEEAEEINKPNGEQPGDGAQSGNDVQTGGTQGEGNAEAGGTQGGNDVQTGGNQGEGNAETGGNQGEGNVETGGNQGEGNAETGGNQSGNDVQTGGNQFGNDTQTGGNNEQAGGTQSGNDAQAGGTQGGNEAQAGGTQSGTNEQAGGTQSGNDAQAGDTQSGNNTQAGGTQSGNNTQAGGAQSGNNTQAGGVQSGNNTQAGGTQSGNNTQAGGVQSGNEVQAGDTQSGNNTQAGGTQSGTNTQAGGTQSGINTQAGSTQPGAQTGVEMTGSENQTGMIVGKQFSKGKLVYKVVFAYGNDVEVQVVKPIKKTNTSISIPATVSYGGTKCKVVEIANNAFKNNKKLKNVTIGKNVEQIGKKAFYNCKKLKNVTMKKSQVEVVGSGAFLKTSKNLKFKVGSKTAVAKYKKLLKKKVPSGTKIAK